MPVFWVQHTRFCINKVICKFSNNCDDGENNDKAENTGLYIGKTCEIGAKQAKDGTACKGAPLYKKRDKAKFVPAFSARDIQGCEREKKGKQLGDEHNKKYRANAA